MNFIYNGAGNLIVVPINRVLTICYVDSSMNSIVLNGIQLFPNNVIDLGVGNGVLNIFNFISNHPTLDNSESSVEITIYV